MNKKIFFVIFCIFLLTSSVSNAVPNNYNGKGSLLISKTMLDEFYNAENMLGKNMESEMRRIITEHFVHSNDDDQEH